MSKVSMAEMETLSDGAKRQIEEDTEERKLFSCKKGEREEEEEGKMVQTEKKEK